MPVSLDAEFRRRDWFAVVQHDPYLALAELALRERAQAARSAWGLQRMEGLALVMLEPMRWPGETMASLCAAVRRWLPPSVSLWRVDAGELTPMHDQVGGDAETLRAASLGKADRSPSDESTRTSNGERITEPNTRLHHAMHSDESSSQGTDQTQSHRLTRDEIDMLLREEPSGTGAADTREPQP